MLRHARKLMLSVVALSVMLAAGQAQADPTPYKVGDTIEVHWKGKWYPSSILKVKEAKYFIHYEGWGAEWDEWVGLDRIRPLSASTGTFKVGDAVDVHWKGKWYASTVLEVKGDKYFIHYEGWGKKWDEWVGPKRIRPRAVSTETYQAGDKCEVLWKGKWYKATVLVVKDNKYKIHYDGWGAEWDEWVGAARMRR